MDKKISNKLYVYSFVMALIIALFHFGAEKTMCFTMAYKNYEELVRVSYWQNFVTGLAGLAVGYFFLSSAFLFYYSVTEANMWVKMKKRFAGLLIPYAIWNIIAIVVEVLAGGLKIEYQGMRWLIEKLFLDPYNGPLWFMIVLVIYLLAAPFMLKLKKYPKVLWIGLAGLYVIAFVYCACGIYKLFPLWPWWVERFVRYVPIYFTGAVVGLLKPEWVLESKLEKKSKWFAILWIAMFLVIALSKNSYVTWIFTALSPVVSWLALSKELFKRNVNEYFKVSFLIYATHMFWFRFVHEICRPTIGKAEIQITGAQSVMLHLLAIPITFGCVCILYTILKRVPKLYRFLTGNR